MRYLKEKAFNVFSPPEADKELLNGLQRETFDYFLNEVDPVTGLVADKTKKGFPSSISVVGMALSVYTIGVEKKFITRSEATKRVQKILSFFYNSHQGTETNATGYKGFYYHFLKIKTGKRAWKCELSTIDTALFIAGALSAALHEHMFLLVDFFI